MTTRKRNNSLSVAIGAALLTTGAVQSAVAADSSLFAAVELDGGYQLAAAADKDHEGKCGEGKCGGDKSSEEGKCGSDKSSEEGKCGEGRCGADTDSKEREADGHKSSQEGKCGEGKCGGAA